MRPNLEQEYPRRSTSRSAIPTYQPREKASASAFHGVIDGFADQLDSITLANTQATGTYFAQVTPESGALLLLNGQEVVGALTVTGTHASNAYGVSNNPDGSITVAPLGFVPTS